MLKNVKSREEVLELANRHGLAIDNTSIRFNESGLDFQVVLATDASGVRWVLRLPRREDVLPSVQKEKRTLDLIAPLLSVEVPRWVVCTPELIAYKALPGVPAGTIDPEAKAYIWEMDAANVPDEFHHSLGKGMVSLHKIDVEKPRETGLAVKTIDEVRSDMKRRMDAAQVEFGVGQSLWNRWQTWLHDDTIWPTETMLTHGDLHAGHILIDSQTRVTGLIDWTEASVSDPAKDFVGHYRVFGEEALRKLVSAYSEAGGRTWPRFVEHIVELQATFALDIAEFAQKSGLDEYRQMAIQWLRGSEPSSN